MAHASTYLVQPAGPEDETILLNLARDFYAHFGMRLRLPAYRAALQTLLADDRIGRVWLVRKDPAGDAVGYAVLTEGLSLEFGGRFGLLDELFVVAEHRSRGAGAAVLAAVEQECRVRGLSALRLELDQSNVRGQIFYQRLGFTPDRRDLLTRRL